MARRLTYKEVKEFVEGKEGNGCKLLSDEYINNSTKMLFQCKCGNEFETRFANFEYNNKRQCNECGKRIRVKKRRLTYEEVKHYIEVESGSGCKLLSKEYTNNCTPLKIKCKCGNEFKVNFSKFKDNKKQYCNICGYNIRTKKLRHSYSDIKNEFEKRGYILVSKEYKSLNEQLKYICPKHKDKGILTIWGTNLLKGHGCVYCGAESAGEILKKTNEEFISEMEEKYGDEYIILGEYINAKTKIKVKHNICGHEWSVTPANLLRGYGCPKCASSKGEKTIGEYLQSNNIDFISEYSFIDCRNELPLPFDFYLPDSNTLIEYDGKQHYEPVNFGGCSDDVALINHKRTKKHDNIKNTYCKSNNIKLVRIPYWDFDNIEQILDEVLSNKDSTYFIA